MVYNIILNISLQRFEILYNYNTREILSDLLWNDILFVSLWSMNQNSYTYDKNLKTYSKKTNSTKITAPRKILVGQKYLVTVNHDR